MSTTACVARSSGFSSAGRRESAAQRVGAGLRGEAWLYIFPLCLLAHLLTELSSSSPPFLQKTSNIGVGLLNETLALTLGSLWSDGGGRG